MTWSLHKTSSDLLGCFQNGTTFCTDLLFEQSADQVTTHKP